MEELRFCARIFKSSPRAKVHQKRIVWFLRFLLFKALVAAVPRR